VQKSRTSSSFTPAITTTLTLIGASPAALGSVRGPDDGVEVAPSPDLRKAQWSQRVAAEVHPPQPGLDERSGQRCKSGPLGGEQAPGRSDSGGRADVGVSP